MFTSFYRLKSVQNGFAAHKLLTKTKGEYHRNDVAYMSPLIHILECNHLSVIDLCTAKNSACNSHIMVSTPQSVWYEAGPQNLSDVDCISSKE